MRDFIIRESDLATLPKTRQEVARKVMKVLENIQNETNYQYIRSPGDIFQLSSELIFEDIEKMLVFYLNTKNRVIKKEIISIGTLNASLVHPREVFRSAIQTRSASIICVHNHPSGETTPSPEDKDITRRLVQAGEIIGIELLDHIIVGKNGFTSLKELGLV